jgi:hypothetical protein
MSSAPMPARVTEREAARAKAAFTGAATHYLEDDTFDRDKGGPRPLCAGCAAAVRKDEKARGRLSTITGPFSGEPPEPLCQRCGDSLSPVVPVVFRVDPPSEGGQVFALFPTLPSDYAGDQCDCYQHVGGHGGADYYGCVQRSRPASPAEYADLKSELEFGPYYYNLRVIKRAQRSHHEQRRREADRVRGAMRELTHQ